MIVLSDEEKKSFVSNRVFEAFDLDYFDINEDNLFTSLEKEFDSYLELSDTKIVEKAFNINSLAQTIAKDYVERIFETKSGKALLGIRFLGLDITKPFVNIWTNFPIENEIESIISFVKSSFEIFKPLYIRFWLSPKHKNYSKYKKHTCQNYLVGSIQEIISSPLPLNYDNIQLETINNTDFYPWYEEIYNQFHSEQTHLKSYVTKTDLSVFEDSIRQGKCYSILYQNKKIGIIACEEDLYLGKKSLYMNEIVISKEYRGKKLATATQRHLVERYKNDYEFIWGNIDAKNLASTKNAKRLGRKIISSEILLPI